MYTKEDFEIDLSNGVTLNEIGGLVGEERFRFLLTEYVKTIDPDFVEDFLFYENEDIEVLKKFGFDNLIG